jgi:hypothetical protein
VTSVPADLGDVAKVDNERTDDLDGRVDEITVDGAQERKLTAPVVVVTGSILNSVEFAA